MAEELTNGGVKGGEVVSSATDNNAQVASAVDTTGAGGQETTSGVDTPNQQKLTQTPEQNRAWAEMRRKAEQAERINAQIKQKYGHLGITNQEQLLAAIEQREREQEAEQLRLQGYDDVFIEQKQRVDRVERELARERAERNYERALQQIQKDYQALKAKYGNLVPDYKVLDSDPEIGKLVSRGYSLKAAWMELNEDKILEHVKTSTTQKTIKDIGSKDHLSTEKSGAGDPGEHVEISEEKMRIYRGLGFTEKQAREAERRAIKRMKGGA